ncbi:MAG: hypothetical protein WBC40_00930 [Halobacteriota archaeon]
MEMKMNIEMASLGYAELREKFKKGMRNGNWRKLNRKEKALFRAAMAYTKLRKKGEMAMDKMLTKSCVSARNGMAKAKTFSGAASAGSWKILVERRSAVKKRTIDKIMLAISTI